MGHPSAAQQGRSDAHWRTYVPADTFAIQPAGPFLLDADGSRLQSYKDRGSQGFSATKARPLSCLDPYLADPAQTQTWI